MTAARDLSNVREACAELYDVVRPAVRGSWPRVAFAMGRVAIALETAERAARRHPRIRRRRRARRMVAWMVLARRAAALEVCGGDC